MKWTILVTMTVTLLMLFARGLSGDLLYKAINSGQARIQYAEAFDDVHSGLVQKMTNYLVMLSAPFRVGFPALMFLYWPWLSRYVKYLAILGMLLHLAGFIATGSNKGLFDVCVIAAWSIWLRTNVTKSHIQSKHIYATIIAMVLFMLYFSYGQYERNNDQVRQGFRFDGRSETRVDPDHPLLAHSPGWLQHTIVSSELYLCEGYYGLSICMNQKWEPTFGLGSALYLMKCVERFTGEDSIASKTYMGKAERYDGYLMMHCWHTIYPWIASDVSFPGALIVVFLYGMFFAMSWNDSLGGKNVLAVSVCSQFVIGLLYFPCNNQIVQSADAFCAFVPTFTLWLATRGKGDMGARG